MMNRVMLEGLEQTKNLLLNQQIELARQLREIERLMPKKSTEKDYTIIKQKRKKESFVFCAKYKVNGKFLKTKFSLKTTDPKIAEKRAVAWKDSFLKNYGKRENRSIAFYNLLSGYYAEGSELLAESLRAKRYINKDLIRRYHNFINDRFIPYLKQEGITKIEDLKPQKIIAFGGWLRDTEKLTAKTINDRINGAIKQALDYLYLKEKIRYNPFNEGVNTNLVAQKGEVKRRRIFGAARLFDVLFDYRMWTLAKTQKELEQPTEKHIQMRRYLLCLIAATTGLREGECYMLKKSSIELIGGIYFLNIDNSSADLENPRLKTENAYRRVPLHKFVYKAIYEYINFANITGDYLFFSGNRKSINGRLFNEAYKECGIHCGYTEDEIKANNVDFHSFRHFWKTLMSQGGLSKELAIFFMGWSKNMNDMSERYSNIDEIGNDIGDIGLLVDNGRKVIDILDSHFNNAYSRHIDENKKQVLYIEPKEVEITNQRKTKVKYWTYAISGYDNFIEVDEEDEE